MDRHSPGELVLGGVVFVVNGAYPAFILRTFVTSKDGPDYERLFVAITLGSFVSLLTIAATFVAYAVTGDNRSVASARAGAFVVLALPAIAVLAWPLFSVLGILETVAYVRVLHPLGVRYSPTVLVFSSIFVVNILLVSAGLYALALSIFLRRT